MCVLHIVEKVMKKIKLFFIVLFVMAGYLFSNQKCILFEQTTGAG